ncbi:hypothetical protein SVIO_095960 [Streptomyces violaceusniger]|uniref:Uncharacterized protein n=1 Tax=Streptomyces violaceusniger TaxID=68280 RepID=A0A4D4LLN0_STRVO|nr:hypothetical protein SVIO_095960 [Streptomyces violaceusniger]
MAASRPAAKVSAYAEVTQKPSWASVHATGHRARSERFTSWGSAAYRGERWSNSTTGGSVVMGAHSRRFDHFDQFDEEEGLDRDRPGQLDRLDAKGEKPSGSATALVSR